MDCDPSSNSAQLINAVHIFPLDGYSILLLKFKQKLYFQGKLKISVLFGSCSILGYEINENGNEYDVYSPRGHSALYFESAKNSNKTTLEQFKQIMLKDLDLTEKFFENFLKYFDKNFDCAIKVSNIDNKMTQFLKLNAEYKLFPTITDFHYMKIFDKNHTEEEIRKRIAELQLQCKFDLEANAMYSLDMKLINFNNDIEKIDLKNGDRLLICGGKGVGKSTILRYLINKLLSSNKNVIVLDFDIGQSEFMVPGCVGVSRITKPLLGPNYTHLLPQMDKLIYIGDVSVERRLDVYMNSIIELLKFCNDTYQESDIIWIINTMGFTRSIGIDINAMIIHQVQPNLVAQIESLDYKLNYPFEFNFENTTNFSSYLLWFKKPVDRPLQNYRFIKLTSSISMAPSGKWVVESRQNRELVILAYCSQILDQMSSYLTEVMPYQSNLLTMKLEVLYFNLEYDYLLSAIKGTLVALCKDNSYNCIGFGIVREIDKQNGHLYLLTPIEQNNLEEVNCLVKGTINLPDVLYINCGPTVQGLVPFVSYKLPYLTHQQPKRCFRPVVKKD